MDIKDHLVSPLPHCHEQGHVPLDQVAQGFIQPGFEHCQGWGTTTSLGNFFQYLNAADVIETSRKQQHGRSYFSKNQFPRISIT